MLLSTVWTGTWIRQWYIAAFVSSVLVASVSSHIYFIIKVSAVVGILMRNPNMLDLSIAEVSP
jgi:hypothetical protein